MFVSYAALFRTFQNNSVLQITKRIFMLLLNKIHRADGPEFYQIYDIPRWGNI